MRLFFQQFFYRFPVCKAKLLRYLPLAFTRIILYNFVSSYNNPLCSFYPTQGAFWFIVYFYWDGSLRFVHFLIY